MSRTVFFDLNGTLVDPVVLLEPRELALAAIDQATVLAMINAAGGRKVPFRELVAAALRHQLERAGRDPQEAGGALARMSSMPAFPETGEALDTLREAGFEVAVLTQSASEAATTLLDNAGLRMDRVLSASPLKPDPRAYAPAQGAWFVAAHWWDVAGAAGAGVRTAWVSRDDRAYPAAVPQPELSAPDLLAAARAIVTSARDRST